MIRARDEIVAKLMENPSDAKLVRDLGKLYLRFNEPDQNDRQSNSSRVLRNNKATPRSEPSLKLAIHYLEQSIQIGRYFIFFTSLRNSSTYNWRGSHVELFVNAFFR